MCVLTYKIIMKLEDEIKQKVFKSQRQKLALNIIFTNSWLSCFQIRFFKKFGLTQQQYNVLRILRGQLPNPASINLLKDRMLEKMSNASRLVEKLNLKGLIDRRDNLIDRRQADVTITEKGLELLKVIDEKMNEIDSLMHSISEDEAKSANDILDKLRS